MADLNVQQLLQDMLGAAAGIAADHWDEMKETAEEEFEIILKRISRIGKEKLAGRLSDGEAGFLLDLQVSTSQIVLIKLRVLTKLMIQRMINAAFNIVAGAVNAYAGFMLIETE
jgi:hypothetical protein